MHIQYFSDTDTLYIIINDNAVTETRDLDENTLLDLDQAGNLVSLTIEHAQERVKVYSFSFEQISSSLATSPRTREKQAA
jgi:uncharacterized protein YuzE